MEEKGLEEGRTKVQSVEHEEGRKDVRKEVQKAAQVRKKREDRRRKEGRGYSRED